MGISWTAMNASDVLVEVVDPSDTEHDVWAEEGPGDTPTLVLQVGCDALEISGSLDEQEAVARRILREVYAAKDRAREGAPLPPAVAFDYELFRNWLRRPVCHGVEMTNAENIGIPALFVGTDHNISHFVDTTLAMLNSDSQRRSNQHPWRTAPDITEDVDATEEAGDGDYLAVAVTVGGYGDDPGTDLFIGHLGWEDLLSGAPRGDDGVVRMRGFNALTVAMGNLAEAINAKVAVWRAVNGRTTAGERQNAASGETRDELSAEAQVAASLHSHPAEEGDVSDQVCLTFPSGVQIHMRERVGKKLRTEMEVEIDSSGMRVEMPLVVLVDGGEERRYG